MRRKAPKLDKKQTHKVVHDTHANTTYHLSVVQNPLLALKSDAAPREIREQKAAHKGGIVTVTGTL